MLKLFLKTVLTLLFRVRVTGMENYRQAGKRVLIIANHNSFLDPLLLGVFLPDDITFAIDTQIAQSWWLKPFLGLSRVFPMDPTHPLSLKELIHHLSADTKTVIFPEGRISVTGALMKIYDGTGMVADKSGATLLPIRLEGTEYSHFSKLGGLVRQRWFPKITLHILPPTQIATHGDTTGKARRKHSGHILKDIMSDMMFATSPYQRSIFSALLDARQIHGGKKAVVEDLDRQPMGYDRLITATLLLGKRLEAISHVNEHVGVFLPNSCKTLIVVLALQLKNRIPAMLNFTTGAAGMASACGVAKVRTVLTSRKFLEMADLTHEAQKLAETVNLIYLEDLAADIRKGEKLLAWLKAKTAPVWYRDSSESGDEPAVILFTSGSEGTPKGVVLSHANILANHYQIKSRIDFGPQDVILNFLPTFHSFGFCTGTLLPVLNGMKCFFYPSPLHYSIIPEMAYQIGATIMFSTNTFLVNYAKKADPYDFHSIRYVVAGAEKLHESTRQQWMDKFGIRILEGYGATETAPVASVNTPMDYKAGTVGRILPHMLYHIEKIPGIDTGGKLHVAGPNIMLGYLLANNPGILVPTASETFGDGWYDMGDIVDIDDDGFITIKGRSKRFAKISGEMVSLTAVEQMAAHTWPEALHAVVSLPDPKKGEQLLLLTTQKGANAKQIATAFPDVAAIQLPRKIHVIEKFPLLGSGKTDYPLALNMAQSLSVNGEDHD